MIEATLHPLRDFYEQNFRRVLSEGKVWQHDYECSSATHFREFHMHVYPLAAGQGLLVVDSRIAEAPHDPRDREPVCSSMFPYHQENGLVLQCCQCRRTQRADGSEQWDWVPEWVSSPPSNGSGALCRSCYRFHYPGAPRI